MASGIAHDKATKLGSLIFGILIGSFLGAKFGLLGAISFYLGGFYLSPDLDTESRPSKRWGLFKYLWLPYRKLIKHRSFLSHGPLIGTSLRIIYLLGIIVLCSIFLKKLGISNISVSYDSLKNLISNNQKSIISILLGIEASSWLHLLQDGDPLPVECKKKWRK